MDLFGTAGIRGPVRGRVTPALALRVGRAVARVADRPGNGPGGEDESGGSAGGTAPPGDVPEGRSVPEGRTFVLGRDGRETGGALADAVAAGLRSGGADVVRVGQVPTPALAHATRGRRGVMVTASHNPPTDNGLKLFVDGTEYDTAAEAAVEAAVDADDPPVEWDRFGDADREGVLPAYRRAVADHARRTVAGADAVLAADRDGSDGGHGGDGGGAGGSDGSGADGSDGDGASAGGSDGDDADGSAAGPEDGGSDAGVDPGPGDADGGDGEPAAEPLSGVRVAVDCGNGVGARATPQVLRALGADVVAVEANVDGHFPARESKPTAESLAGTRAMMAEAAGGGESAPFDLGLAHDGDADRTVAMAPDGSVVHEDTVLAILAEHYVRASDAPDPVVVTTPNASGRIDDRVAAAGGRVERVRLGYLHEGVADARAGGDPGTEVAFAGEPWKHVHTAFGEWIDGVATAAVLAGLVARAPDGLAGLRAPVAERPYRKQPVDCPDEHKTAAMDAVAARLPDVLEGSVDTEYGVRVDRPDGSWVLVRPSGTEPYLRVYAESEDVEELLSTAVGVVEAAVADAADGD